MSPDVQVALITTFGTIMVALTGVGVEMIRRSNKRLGAVKEQVQNSHSTNLRDDVDRVLDALATVVESQDRKGKQLDTLSAAVLGVREDTRQIRTELQHERIQRSDLERRVDDIERRP